MAVSYKDAGVDIEAGEALVDAIGPMAKRTRIPGVMGGLGGFGGLFALKDFAHYDDPVLVSGTDGVGTKLELAFHLGEHRTVGIDLVAMCVNDIITCGARPLFFLDYFATGKLEPSEAAQVIEGIAEGCHQAGCALLGGETAELPGFYDAGKYDLAGFAVGVVERHKILDGSRIVPGDVVIGVASSGLHSNGFSLARAVLDWQRDEALARTLLTPTRIYAKAVTALMEATEVHGLAHITGGGLPGNLPRVFPDGVGVELEGESWPRPGIFQRIAADGPVQPEEMQKTFNLGIGLCAVVPDPVAALAALEAAGEEAWVIGRVGEGTGLRWHGPR